MDKRDLGEVAKDMNLTLPMDRVQDDDEAAKHQENMRTEQQAQAEIRDSGSTEDSTEDSAKVIELHPEASDVDSDQPNTSSDSQETITDE